MPLDLQELRNAIRLLNPAFGGTDQQDAADFLMTLMSSLNEDDNTMVSEIAFILWHW